MNVLPYLFAGFAAITGWQAAAAGDLVQRGGIIVDDTRDRLKVFPLKGDRRAQIAAADLLAVTALVENIRDGHWKARPGLAARVAMYRVNGFENWAVNELQFSDVLKDLSACSPSTPFGLIGDRELPHDTYVAVEWTCKGAPRVLSAIHLRSGKVLTVYLHVGPLIDVIRRG